MIDLSTNYMGLTLKNPIIVSSSALTNSVEKIEKLAKSGAGAVVLKSLFEEQITHETNHIAESNNQTDYPEAYDYIKSYTRSHDIGDYLSLIKNAKAATSIPVIASIHCYSSAEWIEFARQIEIAGADAIELNINILNTDKFTKEAESLDKYLQIVNQVSKAVAIPVAVKIGQQFSNMVSFIHQLHGAGAKAVVLFNRFFEPDIQIDKVELTNSEVFSTPFDYSKTLRWTAIASGQLKDATLSASTGIHTGETIVKMLLAGAQTTQICSAIYLNGPQVIEQMLQTLTHWMEMKKFNAIADFRGALNYKNIPNPAVYERTQFMKYFASIE